MKNNIGRDKQYQNGSKGMKNSGVGGRGANLEWRVRTEKEGREWEWERSGKEEEERSSD